MPTLTTKIVVQCPQIKKEVDVKDTCQTPPCMFYRHVTYRGLRMYVVCGFGELVKREECVLRDPADPELEEMEEEVIEAE